MILKNTTFDKVVFMYVGALTEHGGVKLLVDAFKLVSSSNAEFRICGRGEDTELVSAIADSRIKFLVTWMITRWRLRHGRLTFL